MPALSSRVARPMARAASSKLPANVRIEVRGRGDFDDLLMPALHGAIAFVEMDEIAMLVAEELHFEMAGPDDELFEKDRRVAERGAGFAAGLFDGLIELLGLVGDAHAAAAAAHGRLDDHRIAELLGQLANLLAVAHRVIAAGQDRHLGLAGRCAGPPACRRAVRAPRRVGRRR